MCVLPTKLQSHSCKIILTRSKNMCERQREQEAVKRRGNEAREGEEDVEEEENHWERYRNCLQSACKSEHWKGRVGQWW